ncbi:MAG TPA: glycoside hydrolase family 38 C-terminal domain-containing protein [Terriglobales bacterium]|nr:glycoside hydrolase family 38 C-terminal domain-containing protein [Terriglobales bacterium]
MLRHVVAALLLSSISFGQSIDHKAVTDRLQAMSTVAVTDCKWHADNLLNPQDPALSEADWTPVKKGEKWDATPRWFRCDAVIPERVGGLSAHGMEVQFDGSAGEADSTVVAYVNGHIAATGGSDIERTLLTTSAKPGDKFVIAFVVRGFIQPAGFEGVNLYFTPTNATVTPKRAREELQIADVLTSGIPDAGADRTAMVEAAFQSVDLAALDRGDDQAFLQSLSAAHDKLVPLRDWMKQYSVRATGNTHIDMAWLWPESETIETVRNTFSTALMLMRKFPDFTFTMSTARTYEWMEEKYPALFKEIAERVKEGRWEVIGGMWVEPDLNLPDGESLTRQILIGKRYFQSRFGKDIKVGWNPDSFGYNWQLPQIYKKSGMDYFVTQKIYWNDTTKFPYKLFWWQAPDGSRLLTYFPHDYVNTMEPVKIATDLSQYSPSMGFPEMMHLYGVGDHGGGPTRQMVEQAHDWMKPDAIFPKLYFATAQGYFDDLAKNADHLKIPTVDNELYLEFHRGVQTTQAETKKRIRFGEEALENAEKFASVATFFGSPYPQIALTRAWKELLFDQFHDIMPGSGIGVNYLEAGRRLDLVQRVGHDVEHQGMKAIAANIDTSGAGVPVIVWNPLNWERSEVVEAEVIKPKGEGKFAVLTPKGSVMWPAEIVPGSSDGNRVKLRFEAYAVPALGYKVFEVAWVKALGQLKTDLVARSGHLENEDLSVDIDMNTGCVTSLIERRTGQETVAKGGCANLLQTFVDKPKRWDAWNIDTDFEAQHWDLMQADEVKLVESGPLRAVIRVEKHFQNSQFVQDITLEAGSPRLDVHMTADWHEKHILLKVAFPVNATNDKATFEIPYGSIQRPTTRNTPAEKAMFEVPALRWADYSDTNGKLGLSLLNNCKYGYDAKNGSPYNLLRLSLLRSPEWPDPTADQGHHEFTYSFYPHAGTWRDAMTVRQGYELNYPLIVTQPTVHAGPLPASYSFVKVDAPNVVVTAIKKAEDDDGLILRFYEWAGKTGDVKIELPEAATSAEETNLMEKPDTPLTLGDNAHSVTLQTKPYEIKTVKLKFAQRR